jgi:hypothetical protein
MAVLASMHEDMFAIVLTIVKVDAVMLLLCRCAGTAHTSWWVGIVVGVLYEGI